ncbi:MAG: energy transducer TonB [Deltaproteobacteria bacterium]|nr:energy transducer TonB [Deltaproteobacteria bacterium]
MLRRPLPILAMAAALGLALLLNLLLFLLIPFLSQISLERRPERLSTAFTFKKMHRQPPAPPPKELPKEPPPPKDLPEKLLAAPRRQAAPPPSPAITAPVPRFEAAVSDLRFGTMSFAQIGPPPSEFDISQVDTMPQAISRPDPVYPYQARQKKIGGLVLLKFLVSREGRVERIEVVESKPPGIFDEAARRAVSTWRFRPGLLDQETVATWVTMPLKFTID